ncbi:MAG: 50S ribosomal protein L28 [Bacillota bacterium]
MAKCTICERGTIFGNNRSHAMNQTNRSYKTNVRKVKIVVKGTNISAYVCTRCLRSNKVVRAV